MAGFIDSLIDFGVAKLVEKSGVGKKLDSATSGTRERMNRDYEYGQRNAKRLSNDELIKKYKSCSNQSEKVAYAEEIKARGIR